MKRNVIMITAVVAVLLISGGCYALLHYRDDDRDMIAVTMSWEKNIVESIVGDDYRVVSMMGSNTDPHSSDTVPSNILDLYRSELYFEIGSGVEWETTFFDKVVSDIPSSVRIVNIADTLVENGKLDYLPATHSHEDDDDDDDDHDAHETHDAHIWTSPDILKNIAALVCSVVSEMNPDRAAVYEENLKAYELRAEAVDDEMMNIKFLLAGSETTVVVWHPAWQYLLAQYVKDNDVGIEIAVVEQNGELTPSQILAIIEHYRGGTIFVSVTDQGYQNREILEKNDITVHVVNPTADDMLSASLEFLEFISKDIAGGGPYEE